MIRKSWFLVFALPALLPITGVSYAAMIDTSLRDNVGIGDVSGGEKSNPLWESDLGNDKFRSTLRRSLDSAGLLERARGEGGYVLNAVLGNMDLPDVCPLSVTTRVRYTLTDKKSGKEVYGESVSVEYTVKLWDSMMNPKILRDASAGAVRANTGRLAERLRQLSPSQSTVSVLQ